MGHPVWERVAVLCAQLSDRPQLRRIIEDGGGGAELASLLEAIGSADDPRPERIADLVDEIERVLRSVGLGSLSTRSFLTPTAESTLPPGMTARPTTVGWTCPLARCPRVVLPEETAGSPACVAGDSRMRPYRIHPR
ncbi:hypothetical protein [Streptomyces broussonetiae]|uniref:Uncharacterized protein n=1 Tax=Streptomyces broussonetiae TaxID=2686304 RepID=A0A6I6NGC2_9ACTN|nr:hypothetical protein [Streptomyces broussonetiae]QHA09240.1 hypothetical protein GQF42_44060 [Streptomyces broussonetiae]